jgi:protein-tyrosine-phosphatase
VYFLPKFEDWHIEDPYGGTVEDYRRARDEIDERIRKLLSNVDK